MATRTKVVQHNETTRIYVSEEEIGKAVLAYFKMQGEDVSFDVSNGGYLRGATITVSISSTDHVDMEDVHGGQ